MTRRLTRNADDVAALYMARLLKRKTSVCILGSGEWASAIAKVVGANCAKNSEFERRVTMFVFEEEVDGKKLSRIINKTHENIKYLPGHKLPPNVIAVSNEVKAVKNADILIFVVPHQFVSKLCESLLGHIKKTAIAISLVKGFDQTESGDLDLASHIITRYLEIPCSVMMGANLANDVAAEDFCEATIGCSDFNDAKLLRDLFQSDNLRVYAVDDADAVEMCGALKDVVACGAGFVDGLGLSNNTKAAVVRLGLMEMINFVHAYYPGGRLPTFFQSCCVADLMTSCYCSYHRKVSEMMAKEGVPLSEIEAQLLKGQKLQGPNTAEKVNNLLKDDNVEHKFPLFTAVHKICKDELKPQALIDCIRFHPETMQELKPGLPLGAKSRRRIVAWLKPCCQPVIYATAKCKRAACKYHTWKSPLLTPDCAKLTPTRSYACCLVNQPERFATPNRYFLLKWRDRLLRLCCTNKARYQSVIKLGALTTLCCALRLSKSINF